MKAILILICGSLFIQSTITLDSNANAAVEDLFEASEHGHETGVVQKNKRCHDSLLLSPLLESPLLPSTLRRRDAHQLDPCTKCRTTFCSGLDCKFCKRMCGPKRERSAMNEPQMRLSSRFGGDDDPQPIVGALPPSSSKIDEPMGLSEVQERYYTVGSFPPGPKQKVMAKLLNIPDNVQLDRLIVLAKNKSKNKGLTIPHPVVIDTAHVFTRNDGTPAELDMELHNVGNGVEISNLTSQLNKELDAAIDTKKSMLGDSHLTPKEIDKIIEHVLDQMKKKAPVNAQNQKEIVGDHLNDSGVDDDLDGIKKKKKKKGSKKHGFIDEDEDIVGDATTPKTEESKGDLDKDGLEISLPKNVELEVASEDETTTEKQPSSTSKSTVAKSTLAPKTIHDKHSGVDSKELDENAKARYGSGGGKHPHYAPEQHGSYGEPMHYTPDGGEEEYEAGAEEDMEDLPEYVHVEPQTYHSPSESYHPQPQSASHYAPHYRQPNQYGQPKSGYAQPQASYNQPPSAQPAYGPSKSYAEPIYEQPAPANYEQPQAAYADAQPQYEQYEQPQATYTPSEPVYQPPPMSYNQAPKQYQPQPYVHAPPSAQPVYGPPTQIYKSAEPHFNEQSEALIPQEENLLGSSKDKDAIPEDPTLKASWFENEYKRLRQWIEDNNTDGKKMPLPEEKSHSSGEKEELVDKFTKVIEKDLTEGKTLTPAEKKNLDKKISKMVREDLNSDDPTGAESKSRKKLDKLEELVEEEADDNEQEHNIDDFNRNRFAHQQPIEEEPLPKKKGIQTLRNKLRESLDNLKADKATAQKPAALDVKHLLEDLNKALPNAGKGIPKMGKRMGDADADKARTADGDETVGCLEDFVDKLEELKHKKDPPPNWVVEPYENNYHHEGYGEEGGHGHGGNEYRNADKKDTLLPNLNLEKLIKPVDLKNPLLPGARSDGMDEPLDLPKMIKDLEKNLEKNLRIPGLPPFNNQRQHKPLIPKLQVNGQNVEPEEQNPANLRPLPEIHDRIPPPPQFQHQRNFPEQFGPPPPQQFQNQMNPMNQFHDPRADQMQMEPSFVGAAQQHTQQPQNHPINHFGVIIPEGHEQHRFRRDLGDQLKKQRMYFIGDGIKLPLHMHRLADGTLNLSVDLQKLCKCNNTDCKNSTANTSNSHKAKNMVNMENDIADVPLLMATPKEFATGDKATEKKSKHLIKRSPRFDYYNLKQEQEPADDERFDDLSPIKLIAVDKSADIEKKVANFNKDINEYYANEDILKNEQIHDADDANVFLKRRLGLLTNILSFLRDIVIETTE